jgi:hypothetical protein
MAGVYLPELAEALALRRAVELARDEGLEKVIFFFEHETVRQKPHSNLLNHHKKSQICTRG